METILAITLNDSRATCLKLEVYAKVAVVVDYFYSSCESYEELKTILPPVLQRFGRCDSARLSLSSASFYFRNISLPFSEEKKIEKVLVHELEDSTSYSCADMHYDYLYSPDSEGGTELIVALIGKQRITELITLLGENRVDPDVITITEFTCIDDLIKETGRDRSFMMVKVDGDKVSLSAVNGGRLNLIRSITLPVQKEDSQEDSSQHVINSIKQILLSTKDRAVRTELPKIILKGESPCLAKLQKELREQLGVSCLIQGPVERQFVKIEPIDNLEWDAKIMDDSLALGFIRKNDLHSLNFRKGDFRKQRSIEDLKKVFMAGAVMVILLSVGFGLYGGYELNRLKKKQNELKAKIESVFKQTLPEVTRIVRPVEQLQVKVDEVRNLYSVSRHGSDTMSMVRLMAEISSRIPPELQIILTRFVADGDSVRLRGETRDFKTVDGVQKSLEQSPSFKTVIISSANLATTGEGVRFEIKLEIDE